LKNQFLQALFEAEGWIALALTGASIAWPALLPAALAGMLLWGALRIAFSREFSRRTAVDWCVGLVVVMGLVSLLVSSTPEVTRLQVQRLMVGVLVFYALVNWVKDARKLRILLALISAAGAGLALAAPFLTSWQEKLFILPSMLDERLPFLVNDLANPNVLAGSLALILPLAAGRLFFGFRSLSRFEVIFYSVTLVLISTVLVLSQSRGAWLALILAGAFLFSMRWKRAIPWVGGVILATSVAVLMLGGSVVLGIFGAPQSPSGETSREALWLRAGYILRDFPYSGVGMGGYGRVVEALYPFEGKAEALLDGTWPAEHAHNLLLQIGIDLGIPGLIGWLGAFLLVVYAAWTMIQPEAERGALSCLPGGFGEGLLAAQLVLILHGLVDAVTWGMVRPAPLVWILWGAVMAGALLAAGQLDTRSNVKTERQ
jgi:putative inorganic carbon (HCO3(-)) transporter